MTAIRSVCASIALGLSVGAGVSSAGIVNYSGQIEMLLPPEGPLSFQFGALTSDQHIRLHAEASGHVLQNNLVVDIPGTPGTYTVANRPTALSTIAAGTQIDSYFLHLDLEGSSPTKVFSRSFSITFAEPIMAVIIGGDWYDATWWNTTLDESDFLAGPGVTHTKNADNRRRGVLEYASTQEFLTISPDGLTLSGTLRTRGDHVDNVRVITASIIPTPGAVTLVGLAGLVALRRRRV